MPPALFVLSAARAAADKSLTWINRCPSAPLRQGPVIARRMVRPDSQNGRPKQWLRSHPLR